MKSKQMDSSELEYAETKYIRDIETKVFQEIVMQCVNRIEGICLVGSNLIDSLLGRDSSEKIKGIHIEQDENKHSVYIRIEVNILYGLSIPEKAEEIQTKVVEEVCNYTGLHVSCVHVVFKNLVTKKIEEASELVEEYSDGF
jgi:uncharacterized alkaline shock family protein YloU